MHMLSKREKDMFLSLYITNHLQTRNLLAIQLVST